MVFVPRFEVTLKQVLSFCNLPIVEEELTEEAKLFWRLVAKAEKFTEADNLCGYFGGLLGYVRQINIGDISCGNFGLIGDFVLIIQISSLRRCLTPGITRPHV